MDRRSFLKGLVAVAAAPAIVKAENLMKVWVPRTEIITDPYGFAAGEYTAEVWASGMDGRYGLESGKWYHLAVTKNKEGVLTRYVNGEAISMHDPRFTPFDKVAAPIIKDRVIHGDSPHFNGYINDLRLIKGVSKCDGYTGKIGEYHFQNGIYIGE